MEYDPRYLQAIDEFNQGLFYEAHETLEQLWLEDHGPEREFYQGIIQVAAGYFKWEQDVPRGAVKLLRSAIGKLEPYRPACLGVRVTELLVGRRSGSGRHRSVERQGRRRPRVAHAASVAAGRALA